MELGFSVTWMILVSHVLCCCLMVSQNLGIVEAAEILNNVEDLDLEQQLKLLNKPAVKIIKSICGEEYGCVDFYKQSVFDNPSMMNHTFHYKMRMTSFPGGSNLKIQKSSNKTTFGYLWENGVGCPIGTVPMLRISKDSLLRLKSLDGDNAKPRGSWSNTYKPMAARDGHHFAVVRTNGKPKSYNGASMSIGIYTPTVLKTQFSSARMHFQIGNDYVQAGWTVNPNLYNDGLSRLFVYTNAGGRACYNTRCPSGTGLILVRRDFPPGLPLESAFYRVGIDIIKDKANGNWWLLVNDKQIGFWPSKLFKVSYGTAVEWGGEVYTPPSVPSPPMGNGHFPVGDVYIDSQIRLISVIERNFITDKNVKNTEGYSDNNRGYKVTDDTIKSGWSETGHILFYGGPGKI